MSDEHFSQADAKWRKFLSMAIKRMKMFSVHRVSVIAFLVVSVVLLFAVLFVALPSARIRIWPSVNLVSHTVNVVLVASGAAIDFEPKNALALLPIRASIRSSLTFTEISKKFLGENAEVEMTIINESDELYSLSSGTRLVNQAGMIFRTLAPVNVPAATQVEPGIMRVRARATPQDLYDQMVGDRGNVPAGIKWEIPGLPLEERKLVYARNAEAATGGVSRYGQELQEKDLELARKQLEQELLLAAKARTAEEISLLNATQGKEFVPLQYDVLISTSFSGFVIPMQLIGQEVESVPIEGAVSYTVLAYDKDALLALLLPGLRDHIEDGRELIADSVVKEGISVHVIEYDDGLRWVKITAELTGKERSVLTPISRPGRVFGERVREMVLGKSVQEAIRIIQNFPEVDRVEISVWPPWRGKLPSLMSNISIVPYGL